MVDAGPQYSKRPGEHLKNAFAYQRDIDQFTPIVQGLLHRISVPPRSAFTTTLDPISFHPAKGTIRSAQNPRQEASRNLEAAAVSYGVGGMFSHWTNNTPRHHPMIERSDLIGDAEWDVLYDAAERVMNTHCDVFSSSIRHTVVKEVLSECYGDRLHAPYGVQELPVAGERRRDNSEFVHFTGADTILGPLLDKPDDFQARFTILPEHRVKMLGTYGSRVEYALVHDLITSRTIRFEADLFVLAGGSILSAQVLWNSGIRPPALGRYLTEHPLTFTQVVFSRKLVEKIKTDARFAERVSTVEPDDPVPCPMHDPPPMVWIPVSSERPWHCQIHRDSFAYGGLPDDIDERLVVDLRWFGMIDPCKDNRVLFEDDLNDKFGMPHPRFEYALGENDTERAHAMMSDMIEAAHALGGFLTGSEPRFMPPGTSLHFMGIHRMGQEDGTSVTDPFSKVWGYQNLYLGGNGMIPTATAANPTLTSVALAIRAASKIVGKAPEESTAAREMLDPMRPVT
jgi:pyranose oxidase